MKFCTSVHCMDGRIQENIVKYLKKKYQVEYVDVITEPGPCRLLADNLDKVQINSILARINISLNKHQSKIIAISGHFDCAGNPVSENIQREQVKKSIQYLENRYPQVTVVGLWIDETWTVNAVQNRS